MSPLSLVPVRGCQLSSRQFLRDGADFAARDAEARPMLCGINPPTALMPQGSKKVRNRIE